MAGFVGAVVLAHELALVFVAGVLVGAGLVLVAGQVAALAGWVRRRLEGAS